MSTRVPLTRPAWLPAAVRRPRPQTLVLAAVTLALLVAGWFWLRDSSLVAVRTVEVGGLSGPQAGRIEAALDEAARSMTTLHVREDALTTAVANFSLVKRIEVTTDFPHTMRIHVVTNVAVGAVLVDGRRIAVTSDGTLLRDVSASARLPTIPVHATPTGTRLTERGAVTAVAALGAAPAPLRRRVADVVTTAAHGLTIRLANGPVVYFGDGSRLVAKWAAAAAVLADAQAAGASTIDVTAPERPAVAGVAGGAPATGESDIPTPPPGSEATTSTTATTPESTATTSTGLP